MGKSKAETFAGTGRAGGGALHPGASQLGASSHEEGEEGAAWAERQTTGSEGRNLRRLQVMMQLLLESIAQDPSLSVDEAAQMVALTRRSVLRMFPEKEDAFNLLCRPRIQRAMRARFLIQ